MWPSRFPGSLATLSQHDTRGKDLVRNQALLGVPSHQHAGKNMPKEKPEQTGVVLCYHFPFWVEGCRWAVEGMERFQSDPDPSNAESSPSSSVSLFRCGFTSSADWVDSSSWQLSQVRTPAWCRKNVLKGSICLQWPSHTAGREPYQCKVNHHIILMTCQVV